jgi:hypothetical protein
MNTRTWVQVLGKAVAWLGVAGSVALLTGCVCMCKGAKARPEMTAHYTSVPVTVDGDLNDPAWKTAQVYPLSFSVADKTTLGTEVTEAGEARICWDDNYFYLGVKFYDSDVVAEGKEDQLHHYLMGDVAELFLKPVDKTWYWEMYVTPAGRRTTLWFPGRGRLGLKSCEDHPGNLRVAALCQGTLNKWEDKDTSWTGEMAVPIKELTARGETFGVGSHWTILVSRYNYGAYLSNKELSMTPRLSQTNYHLLEEYAILNLVK